MIRQLIRKEFYLHRSSLLFALAVVALWVALIALTPQADRELIPNQLTMGGLVSLLQTAVVGISLLVILPLLFGATLAAEERKLEVWDWQLSLPASRALQWIVKIAVAACLTLLLSLGVLPLLDTLMAKALPPLADPYTLPSQFLHFNPAHPLLPLLIMASTAFASSLLRDPYRAFFGGMVVALLAMACVWLADPAMLLLQPWVPANPEGKLAALPGTPGAWTSFSGPYLIIAITIILSWLGWLNFRYEPWRWWKLTAQLAALVLLIAMVTAFFLWRDYSPASLFTNRMEDVRPLVQAERAQFGAGKELANGAGYTPLLALRPPRKESNIWRTILSTPGYGSRDTQTLFGNIYRNPETGRLLAEISTFPIGSQRRNLGFYLSDNHHFADIDPATSRYRLTYRVGGRIQAAVPGSTAFLVNSPARTDYVITRWPIPLRFGGRLYSLWAGKKKEAYRDLQKYTRIFTTNPVVDGKETKVEGMVTLNSAKGLYQVFLRQDPRYETWLLRRNTNGAFTAIDKQTGYMQYVVSSDGKWFCRSLDNRPGYADLSIRSVDDARVFPVEARGETIWLSLFATEDSRLPASRLKLLGNSNPRMMQVSPSGNYLAFVRTPTVKVKTLGGEFKDTGFPRRVQIRILDLRTGREFPLNIPGGDLPPDRVSRERFQREMEKWLWTKWLVETSGTTDSYYPALPPNMPRKGETPPPQFSMRALPVMAWAPDADKLAILYDHWFLLGEPRFSEPHTPGAQPAGFELVPYGRFDMTGYAISNFDFLDSQTLLAWGKLGLFKIDLRTAGRPPAKISAFFKGNPERR